MSSRLADRLAALRRQRFVGRDDERTLFSEALASPQPPFNVLHVCGPGGVGKTTLLREFMGACEQAQVPAWYLDARNLEPAPEAFLGALGQAMGAHAGQSPVDAVTARPGRQVVFVDTYELLRPLDQWLREELLPQFPERLVTVFAGRETPVPAWRSEWQSLMRTINLRNLEAGEVRDFLARRAVPAEQHQAVLDFTRGHPLALTLVADVLEQRPGHDFHPEAAPDVIRTLLERFVEKVPSPEHRTTLEACALLRMTTEPLLAELLGVGDAHEYFRWLRSLSFVDSGPLGLFPHDLARDALSADLRWRNRDRFAELHERARGYYARALIETRGHAQQRVLADYMYLHRDNPVVKPFIDWAETGTTVPYPPEEGDWPLLREMVARHEGAESAAIAAHWFARQPEGVMVFRGMRHEPIGFMAGVRLEDVTDDDRNVDPAIAAALDHLARSAPLRRGERATHFRFWMADEAYQSVSAIQSLVFLKAAQHYLTAAGLAYSFFTLADAGFWAPFFAYADLFTVPEADFAVGGRRYTVFCHDWRAVPPMIWLDILAQRELDTSPSDGAAAPSSPSTERVAVLGEGDFTEAVRAALKGYAKPRQLRTSPLLRSRVVTEKAGAEAGDVERVSALQALLREAAEPLKETPKLRKLYDALHHGCFEPAASQERAAQRLYVSFSSFRRHLKEGMDHVADSLWQREVSGSAALDPD